MISTTKPATAKQVSFLTSLLNDRVCNCQGCRNDDGCYIDPADLDSRDASRFIDLLLKQPRKTAVKRASAEPLTVGVYRNGDDVIRVYPARQDRTRLLAKRFEDGEWIYLGLASKYVSAAQKLPLEDVAQYGKQTGWCMICGAELTDPTSISRGIGPVCEANYR